MGSGDASAWLRNRARLLGAQGETWLAGLPGVVADLLRRWALTVERELDGGTGSWVARVRRADGTPAVLKIALPDGSGDREADVLRAADGRGYVRLLDAAPEHVAVLLELLGPSLDHSGLAPERQITVLCDLLRDAWRVPRPDDLAPEPKAHGLAALVTRLWEELGRPCSRRVVDRALECARRRGVADRLVVVHGDPHPGNALRRADGFAFVDPDGFVADPAYDVGVVLRDWCPQLLAGDPVALADRYARLAAARTGLDRTAIVEWAFLERVSTGLFVLSFGRADAAAPFLATAERLAQGWRSGVQVDVARGSAGSA